MVRKSGVKRYISICLCLVLIVSGLVCAGKNCDVHAGETITITDGNGDVIYSSNSGGNGTVGNSNNGNTGNVSNGTNTKPAGNISANTATIIYDSGSSTEGQCYFGTNERALFDCTVDAGGKRLILHRYIGSSRSAVVYGKAIVNGSEYKVYIQKLTAIYRNQPLYSTFSKDEAFCRYMKLSSLSFVAVDGQKVGLLAPKTGMTSMVYAAKGLFYGGVEGEAGSPKCHALEKLDLRGLDLSAALDMSCLFYCCSSLKYLELEGVQMNPTNMYWMFNGCGLENLDLRWINTSNVTNMFGAFEGCGLLKSIEFGTNFNTSNVTDMKRMFNICSNLTHLDLSCFDTSKVTNMSQMFYSCKKLEDIIFGSRFITSKVTDMSYMFFNCAQLEKLDVSFFDVSQVQDMRWMFRLCSKLKSLDLSKWNTSSALNMERMFESCHHMISLDLSSFNTSRVSNFEGMFKEFGIYRKDESGDLNKLGGPVDVSSFDFSKISSDIFNGENSRFTFYSGDVFIIAPKAFKTVKYGEYAGGGGGTYRLSDYYRKGGSAINLDSLKANPIDRNKIGLCYQKDSTDSGNLTEESLGLKPGDVLLSTEARNLGEFDTGNETSGRYGTAVIEYKANGGINNVNNPDYFINTSERFYTAKNGSSKESAFFLGSRSAMKLRYDSYIDYCATYNVSFTYDAGGTKIAYTKSNADFERWYSKVYIPEWYSKYATQKGLTESYQSWISNTYPKWYTSQDTEYVNSTTITILPAEREGYIFTGWYTNKSLDASSKLPGNNTSGYKLYCGNVRAIPETTGYTDRFILYAGWAVDPNYREYRISYKLNGGAASGNPLRFTKNTETFMLTDPIKAGYVFAGWKGTGINGTAMTVTVSKGTAQDLSFEAVWTPDPTAFRYEDDPLDLAYNDEDLADGNEIVSSGIFTKNTYTDEDLVKASEATIFANGGKNKTENKNFKSVTFYVKDRPENADYTYKTASKRRSTIKTFKGKIVTVVTLSDQAPEVKKGKVIKSKAAEKIASVSYKKKDNSIVVNARTNPGTVYVWVLLMEKKRPDGDYSIKNASYVRVNVKLAPSKLFFSDEPDSDEAIKKSEGHVGDSEVIYIVPYAKTGDVSILCRYTISLSKGAEEFISLERLENNSKGFRITAKALKKDKKVSVKIYVVCAENNKKATFTYTVIPS